MNMHDCLLKALRCALWNQPFDDELNSSDFKILMALAEEQVVVGLVFQVLSSQKKQIGFGATIGFVSRNEQIRSTNILLNIVIKKFVKAAKDNHFDSLIVKGQTVGCLYPTPELRTSGDIDILMREEYPKSKIILERMLSIELPEKMIEKELSFYQGKTRFDLHNSIVDFCCSKHQRYWDGLIASVWEDEYNVIVSGTKVRTLPPTIYAIYVFLHIFFHFIREGVALRQFCDWAMVLHHFKNDIDHNKIEEHLKNLGVIKAYRAFGTILIDGLGLSADDFPFELDDRDREWKKKIIGDVFKGGNFGRKNHLSTSTIGYKIETLRLMAKNNFRYYSLAPSEMRMMIPKMIWINLRLLLNR
jgi:hypothetical protein